MSFQWLQLRISEEQDRRKRRAMVLERLPRALQEVHDALAVCVKSYRESFGTESAELQLGENQLQVIVREEQDGEWLRVAGVTVVTTPVVPGFHIERGGAEPYVVEVGTLPGDKLYYRDQAADKYLSMEEVTRRVLDRAFFPKLPD
jgi:hypothetical protein